MGIEWKTGKRLPESGYFLAAHWDYDGWIYEIAWYEPSRKTWIVDPDGRELKMALDFKWARINAPE